MAILREFFAQMPVNKMSSCEVRFGLEDFLVLSTYE